MKVAMYMSDVTTCYMDPLREATRSQSLAFSRGKKDHKDVKDLHKDIAFWFQGTKGGGYQKSCVVASSSCLCSLLEPCSGLELQDCWGSGLHRLGWRLSHPDPEDSKSFASMNV